MLEQDLPCGDATTVSRPIFASRPDDVAGLFSRLTPAAAGYLRGVGFAGRAGQIFLLPGEAGVTSVVIGLGGDRSGLGFGALPAVLPEGDWHLEAGAYDSADAVLGFCLGAYRFRTFKQPARPMARAWVTGSSAISSAAGC